MFAVFNTDNNEIKRTNCINHNLWKNQILKQNEWYTMWTKISIHTHTIMCTDIFKIIIMIYPIRKLLGNFCKIRLKSHERHDLKSTPNRLFSQSLLWLYNKQNLRAPHYKETMIWIAFPCHDAIMGLINFARELRNHDIDGISDMNWHGRDDICVLYGWNMCTVLGH